ncbi:DUF2800 domain-containing protein [Clostridium cellulovorans]|uniref:DUF2800 domain-containing protein n=1 Tax=Clostridium cellulovorans (strain ATCC 35296 / DSM 3052 / OCM 3 / 743B) TaxID=573061 RepID=D9SSD2_CLOC7|nr:DUF2800 domain-containing protein [Clostridium cellulovorans]ADL50529.1 Protein of unknown function DUF2800 [Clostridium cellulovorans 743B]
MSGKAHATLSASGSKRWLACTPSAQLELQFKEETSIHAETGTLAHEIGELMLAMHLKLITKQAYSKELKRLKKNSLYSKEMDDYVQVYVDYAIEKINEAYARAKDSIILLEQMLDFSNYVPDGFGTGDLVIISEDVLDVVDLKYGMGVAVSAKENSQMKLYALGALNLFDSLFDIKRIRMTICQPRLDSISTYEIAIDDLISWAETELKPKAQLATNGEGDYLPGEHCGFCRARKTCRARADQRLAMTKYDFKLPPLLSDEEIAEVLSVAEGISSWVNDVYAYATNLSINEGKRWSGFKLVEGRSNRKYISEEAVIKVCNDNGITEIYTKSLLGITAMEKLLGKDSFNSILGDLVEKPKGKPTLVPFSDKRKAIEINNMAEADFREEI